MFIKIFGKETISELDWSSIINGSELKGFYKPMVMQSSKIFVRNSGHSVEILQINDRLYPLTLGKKTNKGTCYLFSFLAQYVDYGREEILSGTSYSRNQKIIARYVFPLFKYIGNLLGMENVVFVNNYFLATNLYEPDTFLCRPWVIQHLKKRYPDSAIVFRSVNDATDISLLNVLKSQGGLPLACRRLYILDPKNSTYRKKRPVVQDRKLWEKTEDLYWEQVEDISNDESELLLTYYSALYLEKYSSLNPDYTLEFLKKSLKSNILYYYLLREKENHKVLAVQAIQKTKEVVCTPFIGYDQSKPKAMGLYRLMNLQLTNLAVAEEKILNMSSGASTFKRQRGGKPCFDYHVVFADHLSKNRQWIWKKLYAYSESRIKPTMTALGV